ncbi:MAG: hypothetical protein ACE5GB_15330, partial [Acidimicrobiales bacterium]
VGPGREVHAGMLNLTGPPRLPALAMFIGSELSVLGSFGSTPAEIETVLGLVTAGRLDVSRSVQREVPLDEAPSMFAEPFGPARTVIVPNRRAGEGP